jgi:hypothetical protein
VVPGPCYIMYISSISDTTSHVAIYFPATTLRALPLSTQVLSSSTSIISTVLPTSTGDSSFVPGSQAQWSSPSIIQVVSGLLALLIAIPGCIIAVQALRQRLHASRGASLNLPRPIMYAFFLLVNADLVPEDCQDVSIMEDRSQ